MSNSYPRKPQVRSAADFLALVPYLLGFHPGDSVIAVALRDRRVCLVARADLPTPATPAVEIQSMLGHLAGVTARQQPTTVILVGYGPAARVDSVMTDATKVFAAHHLHVHDALRVSDGRYFSYLCPDPACCPPEGTPFDPTRSVVAAYATLAGHVVLPDRAALAARVTPVDGPARAAMQQATDRAHARLAALARAAAGGPSGAGQPPSDGVADAAAPAALTGLLATISAAVRRAGRAAVEEAFTRHRDGGRLDDDEAAWLGILLTYPPVLELAWASTDDHDEHLQLWSDLTRRTQPELASAPASLLAFTAWRRGDGALANLAVDRALTVDPSFHLALLMAEVLHQGVPPSALEWPAGPGHTPTHRGGTDT